MAHLPNLLFAASLLKLGIRIARTARTKRASCPKLEISRGDLAAIVAGWNAWCYGYGFDQVQLRHKL
eukprot:3777641-Amphidinium_carterae.1